MQRTLFFVGDEPYCVLDPDIRQLNLAFLKALDPDFFDYAIEAHLNAEDEKRASVALKLALHHSLETFFSLAGALLQAPDCVFAWIPKCSTKTLKGIVQRISSDDQSLRVKLNVKSVGWHPLAQAVFQHYMPATDRQSETIDGFAKLWQGLALEFLQPLHADEYNSLKHGFRIGSGGFKIEVGEAPEDDTSPEKMHLLGQSDYGSSFLTVESVTGSPKDRSLRVRKHYINWSMERVILLGKATHWSILNITSALRIANGASVAECQYVRPVDNEEFDRPWQQTPGVTNLSWGPSVDSDSRFASSREGLLDAVLKSPDN